MLNCAHMGAFVKETPAPPSPLHMDSDASTRSAVGCKPGDPL